MVVVLKVKEIVGEGLGSSGRRLDRLQVIWKAEEVLNKKVT